MRNFEFYIGSIVLFTIILTVLIVGRSFAEDNSTYETMNPNSLAYVDKQLVCEDLNQASDYAYYELGQKPMLRWDDISNGVTFMMFFNTEDGTFTIFSKPTDIDQDIICWESQGNNIHIYAEVFREFVIRFKPYLLGTDT